MAHLAPPRRTRRTPSGTDVLLVLLVALASGCSSEGPAPVNDPFEQPAWTLRGPEVRIGSVDAPDYAFSAVRALAVAPDGSIYTIHSNEGSIRRWTPEGLPAGTVGREGEGPGEFRRPGALGFFGDSLWVMDTYAYRVSYFDLNGDLLGTVTPQVDLGGQRDNPWESPPRPQQPLRDGTFYGVSPGWSEAIARGQLTQSPHVHMDSTGTSSNTVWIQPHRATDLLALLRETGGTFSAQPFGDGSIWAMSPAGELVVLDRRAHQGPGPAAFRVTKLSMAGDTLFHREMSYDPIPLTESRVDSATDARAEQLHSFMSQRDPGLSLATLTEQIREATYAPESLPPVGAMRVAGDGSVWLRRFDPTPEGYEWWILDGAGAPRGQVVTPTDLGILAIEGDEVWGVETDDLDVNYIVGYRIVRGEG